MRIVAKQSETFAHRVLCRFILCISLFHEIFHVNFPSKPVSVTQKTPRGGRLTIVFHPPVTGFVKMCIGKEIIVRKIGDRVKK
jgi:hypothetical protein